MSVQQGYVSVDEKAKQEAQFDKLSRDLERERRSVARQLEKCKQISETASVSSYTSSTDESFVWRGHNGSVKGEDTDTESHGSGSSLVDSYLKDLEESGLRTNSEIEQLDHKLPGNQGGKMSTLENRSYSSGGYTHSTGTTTTTSRQYTYRTVNGVLQDGDQPVMNGDHHEVVQKYTYSSRNGYGDGKGYSPTTPDYLPQDEYSSGGWRPGSPSSHDSSSAGGRPSSEPRQPRGSHSSQGSVSEDITRKTTSYVESNPPEPGLRSSSRSSSQSSLPRGDTGGGTTPPQSQTFPRSFGQNDMSDASQYGPSTMPRSQGGKAKGNITYNLSMKVGDVRGSGADGNVYIQLFGTDGKTAKIQLRQAGDTRNKFEKGKTYKFTVDTVDIGQLERIKLSHDHRGYGSGFFVDEVEVEIPSRNDRVTFPCRCWLAQDVDDGRTERDMTPSQPQKPAPTKIYTVSVRVGEVKNSQTSLYVQLFGEKGETSKIMLRPAGPSLSRFEPGRTYKFTVETVDVGKIERLRMGQDSKTGGQGLYVESIEIDPERGETVVFPVSCWSEDEDLKAQKDIFPEADYPAETRANVDYHLTVRTGDVPGAGTDAPVFIQIIGDEGETERIELSPGGTGDKRFDRARTDKFVIGTMDVGKPHTIRIGQLGRGPESSWFLNEVIVDIPSRNEHYLYSYNSWLAEDEGDGRTNTELYAEVYKVPLGAGAAPATEPPVSKKPPAFVEENIETTRNETVEAPVPTFDEPPAPPRSISPENVSPRSISPENVRPPYEERVQRSTTQPTSFAADEIDSTGNVAYELCLKMGDVQGSGTEGTVFIELIGDKGKTERIALREANDSRIRFEKGKSYKFTIETADVGKIDKVRIGHDSHGPGLGWYLEEVSVSVPSRDEHVVFPCHCWFAEDQGDGKLERELSSTQATYHLALATGDVANGGTEAVPYIQIFGERGDTGIIELRKEGSNGFVRGKTDFFNVDAVDVGKIEKIRVGHDGQGYDGGWFLEEVVLDCPQHGEHFIFPCHCWLSDVETDRQTEREFLPEPVAPYKISIRTGERPGAGTDANVYMQIFGDQGDSGIIDLKQVMLSTSGQFATGRECKLELETVDVGMLEKVRIGHDNSGRDPAWYLDEIMIILREQCWVLPCHDWLDENRGDTERILFPETKTFAQEPDLEDLIEYLGSNDVVLIVNSEAYLQHLFYKDDGIKNKFRSLNGIPALVRLLDSRNEDVHRGAAGTLRNLSFSKVNDETKIHIARCDGVKALMRLLQRTDRIELKELLLSIIWNLSSCEELKRHIIDECLMYIVTTFVIPDSGWDKRDIEPVRWTICFRNGTGILRNLSSAGLQARKKMRDVIGLIDALLYVIRLSLGKPGADAKAVENSVCILRNLSYRLEEEVDRNKYHDTNQDPDRPERTIYGGPDQKTAGYFGKRSKKKKGAMDKMPAERTGPNAKEGVALLWQPETISPLLTLLADSNNAETLEAAAGMIHNLTACSWRWSALLRSTLRREKGLPILVELLRVDDDSVIRADATALRNLALDSRNKVVIGKYAMKDLVYRLPPGEGSQGITEPTYGAIICTIHQLVDQDSQNAKAVRDVGGVVKLVRIATGNYSPKVVKTANQVLVSMWNFKETRTVIDKAGWQYTKNIADEYGQSPRPKAYDDVSLPRSAHKSYSSQPRFSPTADTPPRTSETERPLEMTDYAMPSTAGDTSRDLSGPSRDQQPPAASTPTNQEPPVYAKVNKNRQKVVEGQDEADSWV